MRAFQGGEIKLCPPARRNSPTKEIIFQWPKIRRERGKGMIALLPPGPAPIRAVVKDIKEEQGRIKDNTVRS